MISRASQYLIIPSEIFNNSSSGLIGEGIKSDLIEKLDLRLDNYYLRVLIEGGLLGLLSFVALIYVFFKKVISRSSYRYMGLEESRGIRSFLLLFVVVFSIDKFFLSMGFNNHYFFLFSGIAVSLFNDGIMNRNIGCRFAYSSRT